MGSNELRVADAVLRMMEAANTLPGTYKAEFALVCYGGVVSGAENWACEVDGDITDSPFAAWGHEPQEAIDRAIKEAWRRVLPTEDGYVEIVPATLAGKADEDLAQWLWVIGMVPKDFAPVDLRMEETNDSGEVVRRYLARVEALPAYRSPPGLGTRAASWRPLSP